MIIETTKDLFWLLFGLSLVILTLFICWGMFYMIMMVKDMRETVKNLKRKLDLLEEFLTTVKEKISDTSLYLKTIFETFIKITGWFEQRKNSVTEEDGNIKKSQSRRK